MKLIILGKNKKKKTVFHKIWKLQKLNLAISQKTNCCEKKTSRKLQASFCGNYFRRHFLSVTFSFFQVHLILSKFSDFKIKFRISTNFSHSAHGIIIRTPVDIGRKLNVHKTFRRRLMNVLCTFSLRPVSTGTMITCKTLLNARLSLQVAYCLKLNIFEFS